MLFNTLPHPPQILQKRKKEIFIVDLGKFGGLQKRKKGKK